ncbi:hypothetical protein MJO29_006948 [Puccinia striiformis f. sp. tritici]|uniref:hypothetical protein n=1 Tax=Puccinia striiformis f. sp. tritici TaxID=168172 RepID=UPI0020082758|nr:hypothetical protein Pst134EA_013097 [Puccinia striiformis f. sp. tritici]KAH9465204.1 hypothetical protein Pst134EA_013097 [Puccinia striiformis f. sp. tritici]KAI7955549.1 hypothetical protein MJO29_006948 [Puccinia striiformis f. sp. tritici]KAI9630280.1 hypothetical protein KEM48_014004 [Puccinia striiformis f. sp. tritici PST-130]
MPLEVLTSFIKLIEEDPNSVYLSCVGDTLYAHDLAKPPSLNDATKACEDIKLSTLEKHYTEMKNKINERLKSLQAKLKKGQPITSEEEEWMDGDGNLVDAELLMEKISSLATNKKTMNLGSSDIKAFLQILNRCSEIISAKNKLLESKKNPKKKTEKPAEKSSNTNSNPNNKRKLDNNERTSKSKISNPNNNQMTSKSKISNASYAEKVEVLDWHHQNGKNQSKTAAHFDKIYPNLKIKQPLISKWLKDEASIRSKNIESNNPSTKRL